MEINFFKQSTRTPSERTDICKDVSPDMFTDDYLNFGYDYFDNKNFFVGYHGYNYDGRFKKTAERIIQHYGLKKGSKVLEIGCAKGYLLVEFHYLGMDVCGVDLSEYAVNNAHPDIKDKVKQGHLGDMSFEDNSFDLVMSKELIPHLKMDELLQIIKDTSRVSKGNIFHMIQCGRDEKELELMKKWDNTHQILMTPEQWIKFFNENNYKCDYQFKVLTIQEGKK
jgi:cyclopropane fatty-acyl-phospholipid synthase-like methyltransferase